MINIISPGVVDFLFFVTTKLCMLHCVSHVSNFLELSGMFIVMSCIQTLSQHARFDDFLRVKRLQRRDVSAIDPSASDGTFDISNSDRLGKTEVPSLSVA